MVAPLAAAALLGAGCGQASQHAGSPARPAALSMATSAGTASGTWAVVVMGGPAATHNDFWQLLTRPPGSWTWRLATPPGVASNGGLVAAPAGGRSLVAAFRPSQGLSFSPLAITGDGGTVWSAGVLDAPLAGLPGALAASPGDGRLLALLKGGAAELSAPGGTRWARLATLHSLASTAAGRRCGISGLTGASFGPSNLPVLAGTCTRRATAGVFTLRAGTWHLAGPVLPPALAGPVRVLTLSAAGGRQTALLAAGAGARAVLLAAWSRSGRWALSPVLPLHGAQVRSVSVAASGGTTVMLNGNAAVALAAKGASWRRLPAVPHGCQALALGPGGRIDALAPAGSTLTDWALTRGSATWARAQTLHVPIEYGSSG